MHDGTRELVFTTAAHLCPAPSEVDWDPVPEHIAQVLLAAQIAPEKSYLLDSRLTVRGCTPAKVRGAVAELVARYPELVADVAVDGRAVDGGAVVWRAGDIEAKSRHVVTSTMSGSDDSVDAAFAELTASADASSADASQPAALFRVVLAPTPHGVLLLVRAHHAVVDGFGLRVLLTELTELARTGTSEQRGRSAFTAVVPPAPARQHWSDLVVPARVAAPELTGAVSGRAATAVVGPVAERLREQARARRHTPTALLIGAVRLAVATRFRWSLTRVTVPLRDGGGGLMSLRPLPLVHTDVLAGTGLDALVDQSADLLYDALDVGAPPPDLVGPLSSTTVPGMPDCLVVINDDLGDDLGDDVAEHPAPHRGTPALLAVEVTKHDLRLSGHPGFFGEADLVGVGDDLARLLGGADPAVVPEGDLSPHPTPIAVDDPVVADADDEVTSSVLSVYRELVGPRVGADDNIFEAGATSVVCARLALRLRSAIGRPVTVRALYQNPTARGLASTLASS